MTIKEFFKAIVADPKGRHTCGQSFRALDGIIFMKDEDNVWATSCVVEDDVVLLTSNFEYYSPNRNRSESYVARNQALEELMRGRVVIRVSELGGRLKPNSRIIRDRYGLIRDTITKEMIGSVIQEDHLLDWWDSCWEYLLCSASDEVVQCNAKIASGITKSAFDGSTRITEIIEKLQTKAKSDDYGRETEELLESLRCNANSLQETASSSQREISRSREQMRSLIFPSLGWDKNSHHSYSLRGTTARLRISLPEATNLIDHIDLLRRVFRLIGLPICDPFGIPFSPDNISKLAALIHTAEQGVLNPPYLPWSTNPVDETPTIQLA